MPVYRPSQRTQPILCIHKLDTTVDSAFTRHRITHDTQPSPWSPTVVLLARHWLRRWRTRGGPFRWLRVESAQVKALVTPNIVLAASRRVVREECTRARRSERPYVFLPSDCVRAVDRLPTAVDLFSGSLDGNWYGAKVASLACAVGTVRLRSLRKAPAGACNVRHVVVLGRSACCGRRGRRQPRTLESFSTIARSVRRPHAAMKVA